MKEIIIKKKKRYVGTLRRQRTDHFL